MSLGFVVFLDVLNKTGFLLVRKKERINIGEPTDSLIQTIQFVSKGNNPEKPQGNHRQEVQSGLMGAAGMGQELQGTGNPGRHSGGLFLGLCAFWLALHLA